jgi:hypothetical protein
MAMRRTSPVNLHPHQPRLIISALVLGLVYLALLSLLVCHVSMIDM